GDRARLADDLPALDVLALGATQQQADVLARTTLVEELAEHLDAGGGGLGRRTLVDADDLDLLVDVEDAALDTTGDDGATTGDREDVLDGHEEGLLCLTGRGRDVLVDRSHELEDGLAPLGVAVEGRECRHAHDRDVVPVELVLGEELAHLHLDELDELLVVDHVALVERHDQGGHADLAGEQHVLTRLRHRTVGGGDHEDRTVHLGRAGDHVLDVVRVTRAVDVGVVTRLGLVLDVRDRDGDAALTLLGSLVDLVERGERVQVRVLFVQDLGDGSGQRRLAVDDVTDRADVDVRLGPLELRLSHCGLLLVVFLLTRTCVVVAEVVRRLLATDLLDDLVGDARGDLGVRVELHRVRSLARGLGPQVANVPEHLGQWHEGVDDHVTVTLLLRLDLSPAAVDVTDHRAEERLGG